MPQASRKLRVAVLGCGPIAQAVHLDACRLARNAELYAICDRSDDLRLRAEAVHRPAVAYRDDEAMLADPKVDAVLIATSDPFHVPLALKAVAAKKAVLVEKPLGIDVESCRLLRDAAAAANIVVQVGHNRRFDPGVLSAHAFIRNDLGRMQSFNAWYHDSHARYTMTANLAPAIETSPTSLRPADDPKTNDRPRYYLLAHGSHLLDTARFLGGPIAGLRARRLDRFGASCWSISLDFLDGSLGHLDLNIPARADFSEGFRITGEHGSVVGDLSHPWYHKSGRVECFSALDNTYRRPLGEDAHTYKRQLESFSDVVLKGSPQLGASADDGLATVQALVAVARSCESGQYLRLDTTTGGV